MKQILTFLSKVIIFILLTVTVFPFWILWGTVMYIKEAFDFSKVTGKPFWEYDG